MRIPPRLIAYIYDEVEDILRSGCDVNRVLDSRHPHVSLPLYEIRADHQSRGSRRGDHPALRATKPTTAMPMATVPKINCKKLRPRNGTCTSNSMASSALATRTATGAHGERRHASQAPTAGGRGTETD